VTCGYWQRISRFARVVVFDVQGSGRSDPLPLNYAELRAQIAGLRSGRRLADGSFFAALGEHSSPESDLR
jgi:hypothetical protein